MARIRQNFFEGTLSSQLLQGATTLQSSALSSFPEVTGSDVAYLVVDPTGSTPEIVKVTAHTVGATSATVVRGQDSTTDRTWAAGTSVIQAPIASDVDADTLAADAAFTGSYAPLGVDMTRYKAAKELDAANGAPTYSTILLGASGQRTAAWFLGTSTAVMGVFEIPTHWETFDIKARVATATGNSGLAKLTAQYYLLGDGVTIPSETNGSTIDVTAPDAASKLLDVTLASGIERGSGDQLRVEVLRGSSGNTLTGDLAIVSLHIVGHT